MIRDTDRDWRMLGEANPYWGVLTDARFLADRLDEDAIAAFYGSGDTEVASLLAEIRKHVPDFAPATVLDFGCGVGRLSLALARHADSVLGIDIAPGMLRLAEERARGTGFAHVRFAENVPPGERFDWVNSLITLQHIPPQRGYPILADLLSRLHHGGICTLQLGLFRDRIAALELLQLGQVWRSDGIGMHADLGDSDQPDGTMQMFDYDLTRVLAIMEQEGVEPFGLRPTLHAGHHGVILVARRIRTREEAGRSIPFPLLGPDTAYGPAGDASFATGLGPGWYPPEPWGVWTEGRVATLTVRIDPALARSHMLRLTGIAYLTSASHPELGVSVTVNGMPAAAHRFDRAVLTEQGEPAANLDVPLHAVGPNGIAGLRIELDAPTSPRALGLGDDDRSLGLGLKQLQLLPAGTPEPPIAPAGRARRWPWRR